MDHWLHEQHSWKRFKTVKEVALRHHYSPASSIVVISYHTIFCLKIHSYATFIHPKFWSYHITPFVLLKYPLMLILVPSPAAPIVIISYPHHVLLQNPLNCPLQPPLSPPSSLSPSGTLLTPNTTQVLRWNQIFLALRDWCLFLSKF